MDPQTNRKQAEECRAMAQELGEKLRPKEVLRGLKKYSYSTNPHLKFLFWLRFISSKMNSICSSCFGKVGMSTQTNRYSHSSQNMD